MHKRALIRKKIKEILLKKTLAGSKVYLNQAMPTWVEELPVILIYTRSEPAEKFNQSPRELRRDLQVAIEIISKGTEDALSEDGPQTQDIIDAIAETVEDEMSRDETLGELVEDSILSDTEFDYEDKGANLIGSARLIYTVTYIQASPKDRSLQPDMGDFEKLNGDWDLGPEPGGDKEASDEIDIPQ